MIDYTPGFVSGKENLIKTESLESVAKRKWFLKPLEWNPEKNKVSI